MPQIIHTAQQPLAATSVDLTDDAGLILRSWEDTLAADFREFDVDFGYGYTFTAELELLLGECTFTYVVVTANAVHTDGATWYARNSSYTPDNELPAGYTHLNIDFEDDNGLSEGQIYSWPDSGGLRDAVDIQVFGVDAMTLDGARAFAPVGDLTCTLRLQLEVRSESASLSDVDLQGIIHVFKAPL